MQTLTKIFSSFGLSVVLLCLLALLTWLGTLAQADNSLFSVQEGYFKSFFVVHPIGNSFGLPLPGGQLLMILLFVNLVVGGVVRMRVGKRTAGILITHLGIGLLLISGFIQTYFANEGHVSLFPGESSDHYQSFNLWEVVVSEDLGDGGTREYRIPEKHFVGVDDEVRSTIKSEGLPFDLELFHYFANSRPMPKGPMFEVDVPVIDGLFLRKEERFPEAEMDAAGLYAAVITDGGERSEGLLWGRELDPWTVNVDGRRFAIGLRKERYPLPFKVTLDKFTKEEHPGMTMARAFESDVTLLEDGATRPVNISMNAPLRDGGLVLYQASYGPKNARPGDRLFSTLQVVRNPVDRFPLYACIVIAAGLLLHFVRKLTGFVRTEARRS